MGDDGVLYTLRLYFRPYEWIVRNRENRDKYNVVIILQIMRDVDRPTIEELSKIFDGLERNKDVRFDWKEEYKDLFGKYEVYDVQYNYKIFLSFCLSVFKESFSIGLAGRAGVSAAQR